MNSLQQPTILKTDRNMKEIWLYLLIIIISALLAYSDSFSVPFIFDDIPNIQDNLSIRNIKSLKEIIHPPKNIAGRPVINITLAVNYAVSGTKVWSYHLLNLLIHICASLTLFGIIRRTLLSERYASVSGRLALICTLVWMLHPLQTQAVTYIIQRCESLMGMSVLLTLYCAIRGWQSSAPRYWHFAAVISCMIGVGAKEGSVIAPFLVYVYDLIFVHKGIKDALRYSKHLYAGLALCLIMLVFMIILSGAATSDRKSLPFTWFEYMLTQTEVIFHYLRLAFLPYNLSLDYAWNIPEPKETLPYASGILLMIMYSLQMILQRRPIGFPAFWFFAALAPTSSIIPIKDVIFEHRMYLPLAGLAVLFVICGYKAGEQILKRFINSESVNAHSVRLTGWKILIFIPLLLGVLTFLRNLDYRTEISIWEDTVSKQPMNSRAHDNLGKAHLDTGDIHKGMLHFQKAIYLNPDNFSARTNLGSSLFRAGKTEEAILSYREALKIKPAYAPAHSGIGAAMAILGRKKKQYTIFRRLYA